MENREDCPSIDRLGAALTRSKAKSRAKRNEAIHHIDTCSACRADYEALGRFSTDHRDLSPSRGLHELAHELERRMADPSSLDPVLAPITDEVAKMCLELISSAANTAGRGNPVQIVDGMGLRPLDRVLGNILSSLRGGIDSYMTASAIGIWRSLEELDASEFYLETVRALLRGVHIVRVIPFTPSEANQLVALVRHALSPDGSKPELAGDVACLQKHVHLAQRHDHYELSVALLPSESEIRNHHCGIVHRGSRTSAFVPTYNRAGSLSGIRHQPAGSLSAKLKNLREHAFRIPSTVDSGSKNSKTSVSERVWEGVRELLGVVSISRYEELMSTWSSPARASFIKDYLASEWEHQNRSQPEAPPPPPWFPELAAG